MHAKSAFELPQLKLRGTIVLAAGAVFTIAIASMFFYVVRSTEKNDLASADQLLSGLARAANVDVVLKQHWAVAESIGSALGVGGDEQQFRDDERLEIPLVEQV